MCPLADMFIQMEVRDQKGLDPLSGRSILVTVETGHETRTVAPSAPQTTRIRTLPTRSACTYWKVTNNVHLSLIIPIPVCECCRFWCQIRSDSSVRFWWKLKGIQLNLITCICDDQECNPLLLFPLSFDSDISIAHYKLATHGVWIIFKDAFFVF